MEMNINWMSEIIYNEMREGAEIAAPKEKHNKIIVSLCITVSLLSLWYQHITCGLGIILGFTFCILVTLAKWELTPGVLHPPASSGALCRGLMLSGAALSQCFFLTGVEWSSNAWGSRLTSGRLVCHWDHPERAHRSLWSCALGIFMANKDEYDLISGGFLKYFLGSLYSNLI